MSYSKLTLKNLEDAFNQTVEAHQDLQIKLIAIGNGYSSAKAREYMTQGVGRRLKIMMGTCENIFSLLPPTQKELASPEQLTNVEINLHAFFISVNGILDNLAWCLAHENEARTGHGLKRHDVGLFKKKTQSLLGDELRNILNSRETVTWYETYEKNFRDALVHRIPPYIPPAVLNDEQAEEYVKLDNEVKSLDLLTEQGLRRWGEVIHTQSSLGSVAFYFSHSFDDRGQPLWLHPQILCDIQTVEGMLRAFIKDGNG